MDPTTYVHTEIVHIVTADRLKCARPVSCRMYRIVIVAIFNAFNVLCESGHTLT